MNTSEILRNIKELLSVIRDDKNKLLKVLSFIEKEILDDNGNDGEHFILDKYKDTITQIVDALNNDYICYLNPDTLELEQVFRETVFATEEFEEQHDDKLDDYELDYIKWDSYIKFGPISSFELYRIMERYIFQLDDTELSSKLEDALTKNQSGSSFNHIINDSDYFKDWIKFKKEAVADYVRNKLIEELRLTQEEKNRI